MRFEREKATAGVRNKVPSGTSLQRPASAANTTIGRAGPDAESPSHARCEHSFATPGFHRFSEHRLRNANTPELSRGGESATSESHAT